MIITGVSYPGDIHNQKAWKDFYNRSIKKERGMKKISKPCAGCGQDLKHSHNEWFLKDDNLYCQICYDKTELKQIRGHINKNEVRIFYTGGLSQAMDEKLEETLKEFGYERWASGMETDGVRDLAFDLKS